MPNQKDVALRAGVSLATVSRYLSTPSMVSGEKAEAISEAIRELGYRIDFNARRLKTGKSSEIGIVLPSIAPLYWDIFYSMQFVFSERGFSNILFFTNDKHRRKGLDRERMFSLLLGKYLEGVILFPWTNKEDDEFIDALKQAGTPMVIVDRKLSDPSVGLVYTDHRAAGYQAGKFLAARGHRDFLYIRGLSGMPSSVYKEEGFRAALAEEGVELDDSRIIEGQYNSVRTHEAAAAALPSLPPFSAVFAANDSSAIGFIRAAQDRGLDCPGDFSIIGYDNNVEFCPYIEPALTTFQQPSRALGVEAARLMIAMAGGAAPSVITLQPELIVRESVVARRL